MNDNNTKTIEINRSTFGGSVNAIASKSHAHRLLIAAALSEAEELFIECSETSADIDATASCLNSMGAEIVRVEGGFKVKPIHPGNISGRLSVNNITGSETQADSDADKTNDNKARMDADKTVDGNTARMDAGESGSTLRFLLPLIGVLGLSAEITTHGRLSSRPLSPLYEEMQRSGVTLSPQGISPLTLSGRMSGGIYTIAGNISSQYITGLLLSLPLAETDSEIRITGELASRPYVDITLDVLRQAGIEVEEIAVPEIAENNVTLIFRIKGGQHYRLPQHCIVEGDWSNAAFFLAAGAIAEAPVTVKRLNMNSKQGDKAILRLLKEFGAEVTETASILSTSTSINSADSLVSNNLADNKMMLSDITITPRPLHGIEIDAENIPDLVPILSLVASTAEGTTVIRHIERLRIKESDRVATVIDTLTRLGADIHEENKCLVINGRPLLAGGTVDSYNDHRIAMTAAIAAIRSSSPVTITDPMAVRKSYPGFYTDLEALC